MSDFNSIGIPDFDAVERQVGGINFDSVFHASSVPVNLVIDTHVIDILSSGTTDIVLNGAANLLVVDLNLLGNAYLDAQVFFFVLYAGSPADAINWRGVEPIKVAALSQVPSLTAPKNATQYRITFGTADGRPNGTLVFPIAGAIGFRVGLFSASAVAANDVTLREIAGVPPVIQTVTRVLSPISVSEMDLTSGGGSYAELDVIGGGFRMTVDNDDPFSEVCRITSLRLVDSGGVGWDDCDLYVAAPVSDSSLLIADNAPFTINQVEVHRVFECRATPTAGQYESVLFPGATGRSVIISDLNIIIPYGRPSDDPNDYPSSIFRATFYVVNRSGTITLTAGGFEIQATVEL